MEPVIDQDHVTVLVHQVLPDALAICLLQLNVVWEFVAGLNGQWHLPVKPLDLVVVEAKQLMFVHVPVDLVPALVRHQAVWNVI